MTEIKNSIKDNNNKNNCSSSNEKVSNSLIKKTKTELLSIIFRKNDIEKKLNDILKRKEEEYKKLNDKYSALRIAFDDLDHKYDYLFEDYSESNDNSVEIICELRHKIHKFVIMLLLSSMFNILLIVYTILNLFL